MKGPSIAVMLAGHPDKEEHDEGGEPGLAEAKSQAKDAAGTFIRAVMSKDAEATYRAFRALKEICAEIDELEDAGEKEESAEGDESEAKEDEGDHDYSEE